MACPGCAVCTLSAPLLPGKRHGARGRAGAADGRMAASGPTDDSPFVNLPAASPLFECPEHGAIQRRSRAFPDECPLERRAEAPDRTAVSGQLARGRRTTAPSSWKPVAGTDIPGRRDFAVARCRNAAERPSIRAGRVSASTGTAPPIRLAIRHCRQSMVAKPGYIRQPGGRRGVSARRRSCRRSLARNRGAATAAPRPSGRRGCPSISATASRVRGQARVQRDTAPRPKPGRA
ncbi:hypothetical protein PARU111607_04160 [Palleronia rufa]